MKHFRLLFFLLLGFIIIVTALITWCFISGLFPQALLALGALAVGVVLLWNHAGKLKRIVWSFARSVDAGDTSVSFNTHSDDPEIRDILETFNGCIERFHETTMDLETRKHYYDRILMVMTHEMGNGITPVISLCDNIRKHPDRWQGERLAEAIELIESRSRGINRFLKAYYNLTHIPEPARTNIGAGEFMLRVKKLTDAELAVRGLPEDVCRFISPESIVLDIDTDLISQVMVNLIRNALDAVAQVKCPMVRVTVSVSDGSPCILVEDNGDGLDPSIRESIFQPFLTTKPDGTGVGLYLSRQIVRCHGGDLRLSSPAGGGCKAMIILNCH
ncbi:MAG: HAMP domain-containing histidine kinase [Muribaculaceae bacterium]|nr:HAMP domain-containing histidine kinase [Muribaculaceae bacterium]